MTGDRGAETEAAALRHRRARRRHDAPFAVAITAQVVMLAVNLLVHSVVGIVVTAVFLITAMAITTVWAQRGGFQ